MTILAAYKPSPEGRAVLETAVAEARLRNADLLVVRHVRRKGCQYLTPPALHHSSGESPQLDEESGQPVDKLRIELDSLSRAINQQGVKCESVLMDQGDDHAAPILTLASRMSVELIVVGIRRRSPVGKAVIGSESQKLLLNADCPVLAVKAD